MATILQVAKEAGVSVATVSRVINQSGTVKESTVRKVMDAVDRLGYMPNLHARNLRRNESRTILVLLPNITNQYYANVFEGINRQAAEMGYTLFLCSTQGRKQEEILRNAIEQKQADGAILLALNRDENWIEAYSEVFPIVQCCEYAKDCATAHISVNNYRLAYDAVQHLLKTGHRKIGMLSCTNRLISTYERRRGYQDALQDAGIGLREDRIVYMDDSFSYASSLVAARKLLSMEDRVDAVFCIGDEGALGMIITAREMGIRVPEQLSVIGVDDVNYTTMLHPYLTTMAQPCEQLGRKAVRMLMTLMRGEKLEKTSVTLPYEFIERESSGKAEEWGMEA